MDERAAVAANLATAISRFKQKKLIKVQAENETNEDGISPLHRTSMHRRLGVTKPIFSSFRTSLFARKGEKDISQNKRGPVQDARVALTTKRISRAGPNIDLRLKLYADREKKRESQRRRDISRVRRLEAKTGLSEQKRKSIIEFLQGKSSEFSLTSSSSLQKNNGQLHSRQIVQTSHRSCCPNAAENGLSNRCSQLSFVPNVQPVSYQNGSLANSCSSSPLVPENREFRVFNGSSNIVFPQVNHTSLVSHQPAPFAFGQLRNEFVNMADPNSIGRLQYLNGRSLTADSRAAAFEVQQRNKSWADVSIQGMPAANTDIRGNLNQSWPPSSFF